MLPLFLGLLTWLKVWLKALLKALTPDLALTLAKSGLLIRTRQLGTDLATRFLVFSHRPWRRRIGAARGTLLGAVHGIGARWRRMPLWLRTAIALVLLTLTASSAFVLVALLIIPRPLLDWLRVRVMTFLNKLGVTQFSRTLWWLLLPSRWRERWHLFVKWRIGRQQVRTSRRLHHRVGERIVRGGIGRRVGRDDEEG